MDNDDRTKPKKAEVLSMKDKRELTMAIRTEKTSAMDPVAYEQTKLMARDFIRSGSLPKSFENESQVLMALLAGREMGMSMVESLNDLYYVHGKLNVYGKATPAALRRHGWRIKYHDETVTSVSATVTHVTTGEQITDTYNLKDAEDSGFVKNNSFAWSPGANRKRKLRYGVLSLIIHTYLPEVIGGAVGIGEYSQDYANASKDNQRQTSNAAKIDELFADGQGRNPVEQVDAIIKDTGVEDED